LAILNNSKYFHCLLCRIKCNTLHLYQQV
jgi:hypothetical protein